MACCNLNLIWSVEGEFGPKQALGGFGTCFQEGAMLAPYFSELLFFCKLVFEFSGPNRAQIGPNFGQSEAFEVNFKDIGFNYQKSGPTYVQCWF